MKASEKPVPADADPYQTRAGELAANSRAVKRTRPEQGVLLAIEAIQMTTRHGLPIMPAAEESLREALVEIGGVPFHPPEPVLALVSADGGITVIDPDDSVRAPLVIPPQDGPVIPDRATLRLSPNGRWLFFAVNGEGRLHDLHDEATAATGREAAVLAGTAATAVFSPDSTRLAIQAPAAAGAAGRGDNDGPAAAAPGGTVHVWRLDGGSVEPFPLAEDVTRNGKTLRGHVGPVEFLEFDRSDRWLVSSSPSTVRLWEMDADRLIAMGRQAIGRSLTDYERAQFGIDDSAE